MSLSISTAITDPHPAGAEEAAALRKNGTSAPYWRAICAYCSESVETWTVSNRPDCNAASMDQANKGFPPKGLMFLSGSPLEPLRAGMMAILFIVSPLRLQNAYLSSQRKSWKLSAHSTPATAPRRCARARTFSSLLGKGWAPNSCP